MEPARPLREVFAGLAGHDGTAPPDQVALAGHEGLPADLLIRAIGSYADTAPAEVAEHLSAFVAAPSDAGAGLHLLAAAPTGSWDGEVSLTGAPEPTHLDEGHDDLGHLSDLGHADDLDALDHAPATAAEEPHPVDHGPAPDFGHAAPSDDQHDLVGLPDSTEADADSGTHVPLDDASHLVLDDATDPGEDGVHPDPHALPEHLDEHGLDDDHHDPGGLDHFPG